MSALGVLEIHRFDWVTAVLEWGLLLEREMIVSVITKPLNVSHNPHPWEFGFSRAQSV